MCAREAWMFATLCCSIFAGCASAPDAGSGDTGSGGASNTCTAADADDGTTAAARLGPGSLDCRYDNSKDRTWASAVSYCAALGSGWRLASKGEALKIAGSPSVCRTLLPSSWYAWARSCAGEGKAWVVFSNGHKYESSVDDSGKDDGALCIR